MFSLFNRHIGATSVCHCFENFIISKIVYKSTLLRQIEKIPVCQLLHRDYQDNQA